jgi:hypothetical protein
LGPLHFSVFWVFLVYVFTEIRKLVYVMYRRYPRKRLVMKYFGGILFFFIVAILSAQERSSTNLYVSPATGGTSEQRTFFDENIPMELAAANYSVVSLVEAADYIVEMSLSEEEDIDFPGTFFNLFTINVTRVEDRTEVVRFSWSYVTLEEMYQWNLYIIYSAMANIPMTKPGGPAASGWDSWFSLGIRAGPSFTGYSPQVSGGYEGGLSTGVSFETGLLLDLRLFRYLSFQAEAIFTLDALNVAKISEGTVRQRSIDTFTFMSLMFPFMAKVPLELGNSTLSLYAGAYFALFPWPMNKNSGYSADVENSYEFKVDPPVGFILGADMGLPMGPGKLLVDLRYGRDFGMTVVQNGDGPQYIRDRITVSVGYKFSLIKRGSSS